MFKFIFSVEPIIFAGPLKDITLKEVGLKAIFECEVSKAGLKAEWFKDGNAIKRDMKYEMQSSEGKYSLIIDDAQPDDIAEYCVRFVGAESKAKLYIKGWHFYSK